MIRFAILVLPVLLLVGCGGSTGGIAINGNVTYGGEPIKKGSVTFRPSDPRMPEVSAPIIDGAYQVPSQTGPQAAEYTVMIVGFRMKKDPRPYTPSYLKDSQANNPDAGMIPEQFVPKKHNENSQLKVTFESAKPTYDFKLDR
jgi:hypothetical protein